MDITENNAGKFLYKYLRFNQYSLQLLINQKFYLSSPDLLNDPFEGDFKISNYTELYNEKTFEYLLEKKRDPNEFIDQIFKEKLIKNWRLEERDFKLYLYEYLNNSIKKKFGTTSFSKNCKSMHMWSHYADSHKGFVLVFNKDLLSTQTDILNSIVEVEYNSVPEIKINPVDLSIENDNILLKNKLPEWVMEDEVRIIKKYWSEKGYEYEFSRLLDFPVKSIIGVIYGTRMPIENLWTIDHLLSKINLKNIKSFYAEKSLERDKIIFREFLKA